MVKEFPAHPIAEVGIMVYTTSSVVAVLVLINVSVILFVVCAVVDSPVTLGLSAACQVYVTPVASVR